MRFGKRNDVPLRDGNVLTYRDALVQLALAGYATVDKALYAESIEDHLRRLYEQPPAASEQLVKVALGHGCVRLNRVGYSGGREFVDDSPLASVRRPS